MPTYSYVCSSCGHAEDVKQRMSEDRLTTCPKCKKETYDRQISGGTGFLLKGGGWYSDGYGKSSPSAGGSDGSSSASSSDSGSSSASSGSCGGGCACH